MSKDIAKCRTGFLPMALNIFATHNKHRVTPWRAPRPARSKKHRFPPAVLPFYEIVSHFDLCMFVSTPSRKRVCANTNILADRGVCTNT